MSSHDVDARLHVTGRVRAARVPDQDCSFLHFVPSLGSGGARVDGVAVVEAAADGVALDDLDAHAGVGVGWKEAGDRIANAA